MFLAECKHQGCALIMWTECAFRIRSPVAYPGNLFGEGVSTNSVKDRGQRETGSGGGSPLVRGSGGSCKFSQEISFRIVTFFFNFWYLQTIYDDNQFICHC